MNIEGIVILSVLAVLLVAIIVVWSIFLAMGSFASRLANVEKDIRYLQDKLPKFNTHKNAMTDENMIAQVVAAQRVLGEAQFMIDTLKKIMHEARNNPLYDPELPVEAQRQPSAYQE